MFSLLFLFEMNVNFVNLVCHFSSLLILHGSFQFAPGIPTLCFGKWIHWQANIEATYRKTEFKMWLLQNNWKSQPADSVFFLAQRNWKSRDVRDVRDHPCMDDLCKWSMRDHPRRWSMRDDLGQMIYHRWISLKNIK